MRKGCEDLERFEYKTLFTEVKGAFGGKVDGENLQSELNVLGQQGWELVSSAPVAQSYGATKWMISVFKRKL